MRPCPLPTTTLPRACSQVHRALRFEVWQPAAGLPGSQAGVQGKEGGAHAELAPLPDPHAVLLLELQAEQHAWSVESSLVFQLGPQRACTSP